MQTIKEKKTILQLPCLTETETENEVENADEGSENGEAENQEEEKLTPEQEAAKEFIENRSYALTAPI